MKKHTTKLITLGIGLGAVALAICFQNCSAPLATDTATSASTSSLAVQILSYPSSQQVVVGQALNLSISAYSVSGLTLSYQWYKNGVAIAGALTNSYYFSSITANDAATYYVRVSDGTNVTTTSAFALTIGSSSTTITISSSPVAQTVAPGGLTRFEVIASDGSGGTLSYQWLKNGVSISGANASEYYITSTTAADGAYYSVSISNGVTTVRSSSVLLTVTATTASCSALGGSLYGTHCYIVNRSLVTWASAQSTCTAAGGKLAYIKNASENYYIYTITQTAAWIGGSDTASEGSYVLTDGTAMSFTAWAAGEPNGGTSENCVQMTPTGYWNDLDCNATRAFVCEL